MKEQSCLDKDGRGLNSSRKPQLYNWGLLYHHPELQNPI